MGKCLRGGMGNLSMQMWIIIVSIRSKRCFCVINRSDERTEKNEIEKKQKKNESPHMGDQHDRPGDWEIGLDCARHTLHSLQIYFFLLFRRWRLWRRHAGNDDDDNTRLLTLFFVHRVAMPITNGADTNSILCVSIGIKFEKKNNKINISSQIWISLQLLMSLHSIDAITLLHIRVHTRRAPNEKGRRGAETGSKEDEAKWNVCVATVILSVFAGFYQIHDSNEFQLRVHIGGVNSLTSYHSIEACIAQ